MGRRRTGTVNRNKSIGKATIDSEGRFIITAELPFKNYSKKDVTFRIKLIPNQVYTESIIIEDMITAMDPEIGKPMEFTLHPKEQNNLQVIFTATPKAVITNFKGTFQPVNIIIYTDNEERKFITGSYQ